MISAPPPRPRITPLGRKPLDDMALAEPIPTVEVTSLLGGGREAVILHNGERYRLRVTANDKLILTK